MRAESSDWPIVEGGHRGSAKTPQFDGNPAIKAAQIVSEETAPTISPNPLTVHYLDSGVQKTLTFKVRPPIYFDSILVSIVHEVLARVPTPQITLSALRDVARLAYHKSRAIEASICPPIVMQKPVFDTRSAEPNNMAHLLLDIIPSCLYARRVAGPEVVFLFYKLGKPFRELLDIFGLTIVCERRRIEADVVKIRGTRGLAAYDLQAPSIWLFPHIYSEMNFSSSTKFDKVFLARRGPRRLLNHSDVEETVARFGYRTVFMEDYSLLDQLSIGAQAKHVVAIHGAAMSFLLMNRQIDSIVELLAPYTYHDLFPVALGSRVSHYEQIIPRFDRATSISLSDWLTLKDLPFATDTSLLASLLSNIH